MIEELFGGWSIDWDVYVWIVGHLPRGSKILELGSGKTSSEISRNYDLTSIEHASHFIGMYDTKYVHAEYVNGWYNRETIQKNMIQYDLLLIDGPDHSCRKNILNNMDLFDWSKPVIIDDVQENDLMSLSLQIASDYCKRPYKILQGSDKKVIKSFMVIE